VVLLLGALNAPVSSAREIWEYDWIEAETPNFRIFSVLREAPTKTLAADLENFRHIVIALAGFRPAREHVPTYVYAFSGRESDIGLSKDIGGYFLSLPTANIAVSRGQVLGLDHVVQHEYVHYLIKNAGFPEYPAWMEEGLAEVLAAADIKGARFTYGDVPMNRAEWLLGGFPWLRFEDLLGSRSSHRLSDRRRAMYYAQSWLLVHYLFLGRKERNFRDDTLRYLSLLGAGAEPVASFDESYALRATELRGELREYLTRKLRYYKGELTAGQLFAESSVQVRRMTADQAAARAGLLLASVGNADTALRAYEAALAANADNIDALIGLSELLTSQDQFDTAGPLAQRAQALDPDNAPAEIALSRIAHDRGDAEADMAGRNAHYEEALHHAERASALDATNAEALRWQAHLLADLGRAEGAALDKLVLAHSLHRGNPHLKLELARAYVRAGDKSGARYQLERIITWSHGSFAEAAETMLAEIDPLYVPMPDIGDAEE
jgi:FimV-like protein